ncbi:MAG TPA: ATP-dependent DNA helicase RecG, partial [Candidatus Woesebacteria bacterium]|nr:ATP-dependent DNA helicase RecG [Candidatus Woesebacteria bacterium]
EHIPIHLGRIVPVYPQVYGLSSKTIREKIFFVMNTVLKHNSYEYLPDTIRTSQQLMEETEALRLIHFPEKMADLDAAKERIGFDELFTKMLSSKLVKKQWEKEIVIKPYKFTKKIEKNITDFIASFPFALTGAQQRSVNEILGDLKKKTPMNRFLQGDVGSGKTAVAAIAAYTAFLNGSQTLVMAPTEILAQQHFATMSKLFANYPVKVAIQTQANKTFTKKNSDTSGYDIIIGTQALLSNYVDFKNVGLVIVDEQHRFGVRQRAQLKQKGINPHLLTMTATPIPRTVSLTLYSELDLSIIDEMPKGRLPIKTYIVTTGKRNDCYKWVRNKIKQDKDQVYVICPLIEESESETMQTVKAANKEYEYLQKEVFPDCKVALLHGKMKSAEKDTVMKEFKEKKYDILVSTSVVEVGIDVPNATIMIIEGAERFGLAQLHQLRGRVGRGDKQSYCYLFTSTKDAEQNSRLKFFTQTNSGMKLAEFDFKIRGPGDLYGTQQSGYSDLKVADLTNIQLVHKVKNAVEQFMKDYTVTDFPKLKEMIDNYQVEQVARD